MAPAPLVRDAVGRTGVASRGPLHVVAAGKAAFGMARGLASSGAPVAAGLVAGPAGAAGDVPPPFHAFAAGHPFPDDGSVRAAAHALALAEASRGGVFVMLVSGGASSMLALPAPGVSLADKLATSEALMRAGADIAELNSVRKHLSAIKGGRLAALAAQTMTLAISDVQTPVEDDPSVIGSGPTVADPSTFAEALRVVTERHPAAGVPPAVVEHLARGARGLIEETPKPGDPRLSHASYHVLANRHTAMAGAGRAARELGFEVVVVPDATAGEAREAGRRFADAGLSAAIGRPLCVIASGETTVRVRGGGRGGRNQEFALGAAAVMRGRPGVLASIGTDGIDGPTDAAGAMVNGTTDSRARHAGVSLEAALDENDAYPLLARLGGLIRWGPTGTNVGDVHVLLI